ncbi:hypothetical protein P3T24_007876 [Paraburkholderia sp. GAS33]|uniref:hypothetical protein n=1 Tax=Paraburkholderia sp. GAS33 TaxID=3035130 RepID=UPI003D249213
MVNSDNGDIGHWLHFDAKYRLQRQEAAALFDSNDDAGDDYEDAVGYQEEISTCISRKISARCMAASGASTNAGTVEVTNTLDITEASHDNSSGGTRAVLAYDHAGADRRAPRSDDVVVALNSLEVFRSILWVVARWMLLLVLAFLVSRLRSSRRHQRGATRACRLADPGSRHRLIDQQREPAAQRALAQPDRPAGVAQPELC